MNTDQIETLRSLHAEATPGPWTQSRIEYRDGGVTWELVRPMEIAGTMVHPHNVMKSSTAGTEWLPTDADAALIVAAVNALPDLLAIAEAHDDLLARLDGLATAWEGDSLGTDRLCAADLRHTIATADAGVSS